MAQANTQAIDSADRKILRALAEQYLEICNRNVQKKRRDLWRRHNSLKRTRPLIYVRAFAWSEMPESQCKCEDPFFRHFGTAMQ